jgi:hypothetical protein
VPIPPVRMAAPSAMNAALASLTAAMIAGPPSRAASMNSTTDSPGYPNTRVTPPDAGSRPAQTQPYVRNP